MVGPAQRSTSASALERALTNVIVDHGDLAPSEIVTHYDLVVETRLIDEGGAERIRRHHWSPVGSDPHLSFAMLTIEAAEIMRQVTPVPMPRQA